MVTVSVPTASELNVASGQVARVQDTDAGYMRLAVSVAGELN